MVSVIASHYQSILIIVLLLQACLSHIVAATVAVATTGPVVSTLCESLQCCKFLEGEVEMFSLFCSR